MFEKILIANRGEVAARVARSARRIGADTVALQAPGEEDAVHVQACDHVIALESMSEHGSPRAIAAAALASGCSAVHPGYGLLEGDPELARAVERAGLTFIGPSPELLVMARDRVAMRTVAEDCGVRVLPGSSRACSTIDELRQDALAIGLPLVIKPAHGIGEPPQLVVAEDDETLEAKLAELSTEDDVAFFVERYVERPRHLEVQVVGDGAGNVAVLGEREVSMRKDARRVLAEAPAPALDQLHRGEAARSAVWGAAHDVAAALALRGVASVRFLLDPVGRFWFVDLHPGLAPEHALHEMCTGVDLVEVEVRIAAGEAVVADLARIEPTGHAVQARIDAAMDPRDGRPFAGRADDVRWPPVPTGKVRIETGVQPRSRITPHHDPTVATVTTYAPSRHEAVLVLDRVIAETRIAPLVTNLRLLRRALNLESFRAGQIDEGTLERGSA